MISKQYFAKPFKINERLMRYADIYAIESICDNNVVYGVSGSDFALITPEGFVTCKFDESLQLAAQMIPEIRWEIVEIYWHIKELRERWGRQI